MDNFIIDPNRGCTCFLYRKTLIEPDRYSYSGWLGRAMVLGTFQCRGVLLIRHIVGQKPVVLAAGAGWVGCSFFFFFVVLFFLSRLSYLSFSNASSLG